MLFFFLRNRTIATRSSVFHDLGPYYDFFRYSCHSYYSWDFAACLVRDEVGYRAFGTLLQLRLGAVEVIETWTCYMTLIFVASVSVSARMIDDDICHSRSGLDPTVGIFEEVGTRVVVVGFCGEEGIDTCLKVGAEDDTRLAEVARTGPDAH